jgi:hypothetical protein
VAVVTSQQSFAIAAQKRRGTGGPSASRNLRRRPPGNRHAELLILCARIGFNP